MVWQTGGDQEPAFRQQDKRKHFWPPAVKFYCSSCKHQYDYVEGKDAWIIWKQYKIANKNSNIKKLLILFKERFFLPPIYHLYHLQILQYAISQKKLVFKQWQCITEFEASFCYKAISYALTPSALEHHCHSEAANADSDSSSYSFCLCKCT